jgi:hypothetical protein
MDAMARERARVQGVTIMAGVPYADVSGLLTKASWQGKLSISVGEWAACSNSGSVGSYCKCAALRDIVLHLCSVANSMCSPCRPVTLEMWMLTSVRSTRERLRWQ